MTPAGTSNELDVQNGWEENTHTHRDTRNCSPIPVFCFLYSKILPVTKMRLNVCFNEMALFGLLQLLSKAVAAMAEMEVSPQEEMANSQGMKRFAVERPGLNEGFVSFLFCVECNRRHSYLLQVCRSFGVRYSSGRHQGRHCA